MNVSNKKRPSNHGQDGLQLVPVTKSQLLLDEPAFDVELCEQFSLWLEPRLESLVEGLSDFVTRDSLKRDLRRR